MTNADWIWRALLQWASATFEMTPSITVIFETNVKCWLEYYASIKYFHLDAKQHRNSFRILAVERIQIDEKKTRHLTLAFQLCDVCAVLLIHHWHSLCSSSHCVTVWWETRSGCLCLSHAPTQALTAGERPRLWNPYTGSKRSSGGISSCICGVKREPGPWRCVSTGKSAGRALKYCRCAWLETIDDVHSIPQLILKTCLCWLCGLGIGFPPRIFEYILLFL